MIFISPGLTVRRPRIMARRARLASHWGLRIKPIRLPAFLNFDGRGYRGVSTAAGQTVVTLTPNGLISYEKLLPKLFR